MKNSADFHSRKTVLLENRVSGGLPVSKLDQKSKNSKKTQKYLRCGDANLLLKGHHVLPNEYVLFQNGPHELLKVKNNEVIELVIW